MSILQQNDLQFVQPAYASDLHSINNPAAHSPSDFTLMDLKQLVLKLVFRYMALMFLRPHLALCAPDVLFVR